MRPSAPVFRATFAVVAALIAVGAFATSAQAKYGFVVTPHAAPPGSMLELSFALWAGLGMLVVGLLMMVGAVVVILLIGPGASRTRPRAD